jgi:hypothetical protein
MVEQQHRVVEELKSQLARSNSALQPWVPAPPAGQEPRPGARPAAPRPLPVPAPNRPDQAAAQVPSPASPPWSQAVAPRAGTPSWRGAAAARRGEDRRYETPPGTPPPPYLPPQPALQPPELATWGGLLGSHDTSHPIITMEDTDSEDKKGLGASHPLPPEGEHGPFNSLPLPDRAAPCWHGRTW